jgi:energy-coupling factor transporter ATP-binding protein EcfA2
MKPALLQLKNIGPFDSFTLTPKSGVTILRGPNGSGKSTLANSVLYLVEKSHDPSLIKGWPNLEDGAYGQITLAISDPGGEYDGANFVCTITPDKTTRTLHHPKLGKISVAQSKKWIEEVINVISLDPSRFLTASDKEQVEIFLKAQPKHLTADQLDFVPVEFLKTADLDKHALEVIGNKDSGVYGAIYAARAAVKKEGDVKAKYAQQLQTTLPEDAPEGDWESVVKAKRAELNALKLEHNNRVSAIKKDQAIAAEAEKKLFEANKQGVNEELERDIEKRRKEFEEAVAKHRADAAIAIDIYEKGCVEALERINKSAADATEALLAKDRPEAERLQREIGDAQAKADQHTKSQATRDLIKQAQSEATAASVKADEYTLMIKRLEGLKAGMMKETPIHGLEVADGSLMLDGIPLRRINEAQANMRVCLSIAKMMAGPLGFVMFDNAQIFDQDNLPIAEQIAAELGITVVLLVASARDEEGRVIDRLHASTRNFAEGVDANLARIRNGKEVA